MLMDLTFVGWDEYVTVNVNGRYTFVHCRDVIIDRGLNRVSKCLFVRCL